jgi:hypothetical protein
MFVVEWVQTRPSTDVAWYEGNESMNQINIARQNYSGFVGKEVVFSSDRLTKTTLTKWVDEAAALAFAEQNRALVDEINLLTMLHNQEHNIEWIRSARS